MIYLLASILLKIQWNAFPSLTLEYFNLSGLNTPCKVCYELVY